MREQKTVIIDSVSYNIMPCSPLKAQRILVKLINTFGKPISNFILQLLKGDTKGLLDTDLESFGKGEKNLEAIASAFMEFSADADEEKIEQFTLTLINVDFVKPDGKRMITVDSHFNEYGLLHMYKVMWSVLQVNFSDFLEGVVGKVG